MNNLAQVPYNSYLTLALLDVNNIVYQYPYKQTNTTHHYSVQLVQYTQGNRTRDHQIDEDNTETELFSI
jgi:hypothetical protein